MSSPEPANPPPIIEMRDIAVSSRMDLSQTVLEEINWTVRTGEYWVVAGMQASGKSNLLSMMAGLIPPHHGTYRLFGREITDYDEELLSERLRLGMVFTNAQLLHNLTIKENISLPLRYHRELDWQQVEERVNAIIDLMELSPYAGSMANAVPRNWQKRAGLARALVLEPEVLLLDHPLSGMDLRHTSWWMNFMDQLFVGCPLTEGRRLTLVVTAEDLRPWRNRDCHFAILKKERFLVLGHKPEFTNHQEPLVKELLAEEIPT